MRIVKSMFRNFIAWSIILGFWFATALFAIVQRGVFIVDNFKAGFYYAAITPIVIYAVVAIIVTVIIKKITKNKD